MVKRCCKSFWRCPLDDTHEIISSLHNSSSTEDICANVIRATRSFGGTNLLAGVIPYYGLSKTSQLSHVLLDLWPREWSERYFSRGYLYRDPTICLVRQGAPSFLWSELKLHRHCNLSEQLVMKEASEFHLREGFTVSFATIERQPIGFSIAGERLELDSRERFILELVSAYAIGCALVLVRGDHVREIRFSPRQLDALRWASEGLKIEEIAERLSISVHTADMHLRAVRAKLGVANTVHAVAEALRLRIIS